MRITIHIDTDHPEAFNTLRADLEGMLGHTDEHGPAATWVQIRESVYEGTNVRREWIGEGGAGESCDCGDMACEHPDHRVSLVDIDPLTRDPHAYPEGFDALSDAHGRTIPTDSP